MNVKNISAAVCLALTVLVAPACAAPGATFDDMAGRWQILDAHGAAIGQSNIVVQTPDAMIYEERRVGDEPVQQLWFENSERAGGWVQLFLGPHGMREFTPQSPQGASPVVLGSHVILQDGSAAEFRMTLSRDNEARYRRVLEMSRDGGVAWSQVFDYTYQRVGDAEVEQ